MKFLKVVIATVLLLTIIPIQHVFAIDEITKPTVEHLAVDKKQVTTGEVVYINLGVTNYSEYRYAILYYTSPITNKGINIRLTYNAQTELFEGNFPIEEYVESGTYTPNMVSLYNDGITTIYSHEYDGFELGSFEVKDTAGIEFIQSINVDKNDVELGDTVNIQVQTSSFERIRYLNASFKSPVSNQTLTARLNYNDETSRFEGEIPITGIMENGIYTLFMVNSYEYEGNATIFYSRNYNGLFDNGNFAVSGTDIGNLVEDISINKNYVTAEEKMNFTVKLNNPVGIYYINLNYESPGIGYDFNVDLYLNSKTGLFEGSFTPGLNFEEGTYPLDFIAIYSSLGTSTALYEDTDEYRDGDFTFYREQNAPTFNKISLDKTDLEPGELVKVYVSAEDDTLLSEAVVNFISPLTQTTMPIHLQYDEIQNQFIGEFYAENSAEIGDWIVDTIEIKDTNQNTTLVSKEDTDLNAGTFTIKDVIKPEIYSVNQITDQTTIISGTAEAKSIITASNQETEIGSIETDSSSEFYLPIEKQKAGTKITLTAEDAAGNVSETKEIMVIDVTAPQAPSVNKVTDQSTSISGTGEAGTLITALADNEALGTAIVAPDGKFEVNIAIQSSGTLIGVYATDGAGNVSAVKTITVLDTIAPKILSVDKVTDQSTSIFGMTEENAVVLVKSGDEVVGKATANGVGQFEIPIEKQKAGTKLKITATDKAGNVSDGSVTTVQDVTAPEAPTVDKVTDQSTIISGTAEAASQVIVKVDSKEIATGKAGSDGKYSITIPRQKAGTKLSVTSTDAAGNSSESTETIVLDVTAPNAPTVNEVTDQSTIVSGIAEAISQISVKVGSQEIGTVKAGVDGKFSVTIPKQLAGIELVVTARDVAGNTSESTKTTVLDATAPSVPILNKITDQSTVVTGQAEASSKVEVRKDSVLLGQGQASSKGTFSITIPKQVGNTKLTVVAIDAASNSSSPVEVLVVDTLAPAKPTVNEVSDVSVSVSGQAEPNAKIEISKNNTILASGTASAQGSFTIPIAKQLTGTSLGITAIDAAGNRSEMVTIQVVDKTVPTLSEITAVTSSSTKLSGKTEAGAAVTLSKGGVEIGKATADQSGAFTLTFAAQTPQSELSLVAKDTAGNVSPTIKVVVAAQKEYADLASSHWAYQQVMYLADASIIGGYPDGTFQPNRQTTRAEAARMLASALNLEVVDTPSIFKDVASGHWANNYIVAAAKAGVFKGNPDGTFNPSGKLTRAEMATLLSTAYDLTAKKPAHFSDVKATHWANQSIAAMYENNLTVGYPDGTYRPSNPTTRAEFSMFLAKALNKEFR